MSHTLQHKEQLLARVRRIAGQVSGIEKALTAQDGCSTVLQRISAVRGALNGLMAEVLQDHIETHVLDARSASSRRKATDEILDVVRTYLK